MKSLQTLQQHSLQRITIPAADLLDESKLRKLEVIAPSLQGKARKLRFETCEVGDNDYF